MTEPGRLAPVAQGRRERDADEQAGDLRYGRRVGSDRDVLRAAAPAIRSRWRYAAAVVATIAAGLASRAVASALPWWLAKNAGDALYATMVFFGIGFVAPRIRTSTAAAIALAFCAAVEGSQAYHAPWLDAVRDTLPGHLVPRTDREASGRA